MKKILVTGGAGYLGSVLIPQLLKRRHKVTVVDNFLHGEESLALVAEEPNLKIVRGDIRDTTIMDEAIGNADLVIPLAGIVGAPACDRDPETATAVNLHAIRYLVSKLSPEQGLIFPTTVSVYGDIGNTNGKPVDERSEVNPLSLYARDKLEAEKVIMSHPSAIAFRIATNYGLSPRMRPELLVNHFVYHALSKRYLNIFEAHYMRSAVHVKDTAGAFLFAVDKFDRLKGEIYNLVHPDGNFTKWELACEVQKQLPDFLISLNGRGKDPDQRNCALSGKKLANAGFTPKQDLQTGIAELIQGYLARGVTRPSRTKSA